MTEPSSKHPHLDRTSLDFINNLKLDKPLYEMTPDEAREFLQNVQKKDYKDIDARVEDIEVLSEMGGTINVRLVKPIDCVNGDALPLIIYCHGGGWVMGDADTFDMTIKTIANHTKAAVAFVDYLRAPEHPYPAAINQIYTVLEFFAEGRHNINPEKIAIVGDSAGGNMAAVTALRAKREFGPDICFQALIYPVTDATMNSKSYKEFKDGPWLSKKAMEWFWDAYVPDKSKRGYIYVSPLNADIKELAELPPALIITDENDVLRDEGEAYARKLIKAGVKTACVRINNTHHDFLLLNSLRTSPAVKAAYKLLCTYLKHYLYKE